MELKEGYKQTEVGVIPVEWQVCGITDICSNIFLGLTTKVDYVKRNGVPLVRAKDINTGRLLFDETLQISIRQHQELTKYTRAKKGDILVSKSGTLGICALVDTDKEFSIYESIIVMKRNTATCDSRFLLWLMRLEATQDRLLKETVGSTVGHLNLLNFRKLVVPIPEIEEQKAIATALSDVDALIAALDRLIAKKCDIKQAAMQELLTGKRRLPGFASGNGYKLTEAGAIPEDWDTATIEEICKPNGLVRGPFGGALKKEFFVQDGFKVYEQRNAINHDAEVGNYYIDNEKFNELRRFEIKEGDFIVSCSGTIGKIFQIPMGSKPGVINQALLKIKLDDLVMLDKFFLYILVVALIY